MLQGDGVVSSPTDQADHNHLIVLIFLLVAAITSLLLIAAVLFIIRQRRKTTKVEEDDTIATDIANNKEEPVAEYKVRKFLVNRCHVWGNPCDIVNCIMNLTIGKACINCI